MPKKGYESVNMGMESTEELVARTMFPSKNRFQQLQMLTRDNPRGQMALSVMGFFRRRFNSKALAIFQEEVMINKIAENGEGRAEFAEVVGAVRRQREAEEES